MKTFDSNKVFVKLFFFSFFFLFISPSRVLWQPFAFKASKAGARTFSFAAENEEERSKWIAAMMDASEKLAEQVAGVAAGGSAAAAPPAAASPSSAPPTHRRQLSDPPMSPSIAERPFVCSPETLASATLHGWLHFRGTNKTWADKYFVLKVREKSRRRVRS